MKVILGNHSKVHVHKDQRQKTREFYSLLGCTLLPAPSPHFDLFQFDGGFVFGVFYFDEGDFLSESDQIKGTWLELKTNDPELLKKHLIDFGVKPIAYEDKSHFYFQAPGGQVFRIALL